MPYVLPDTSFQFFNTPNFGELFAEEYGATTYYPHNMPTGYANDSLNTLVNLLFQNPSGRDVSLPRRPTQGDIILQLPDTGISRKLPPYRTPDIFDSTDQTYKDQSSPVSKGETCAISGREVPCDSAEYKSLKGLGSLEGLEKVGISKEMLYLIVGVIALILLVLLVKK